MPSYTFRCKCGYERELKAEFGKSPEYLRCPLCLFLRKMEKVIHCPPVRFVGLGFTRSWADRDYDRTYSDPGRTVDIEKQLEWEEHQEKQDAYRTQLTKEMWERKSPDNNYKTWKVKMFEWLRSILNGNTLKIR